ncbi:MAG: hypothetical protein FGM57_03285 [Candidatus Taylorbacteria bacterium]|nr:hypothetical protein [Candidatus Taylorbacteria bacterium]
MDEETKVNRQNVLKEAAGDSSKGKGPNPDFRAVNIAKNSIPGSGGSKPDFGFVKGIGVVFDVSGGLIGLIPAVGWALNAFLIFPAGLITMYLMTNSRGVSGSVFISAFKHIYVEPIPYLNIIPTFTAAAYKLSGESLIGSFFNLIQGK